MSLYRQTTNKLRTYRNYALPRDIPLLLQVAGLTLYYYALIRCASLHGISKKMAAKKSSQPLRFTLSIEDQQGLDKVWRAASFMLCRVLRSSNPCLCRTLVMQHWLAGKMAGVTVRIGVIREGRQLKSHAWIVLDGKAFREDPMELARYIPIIEWQQSPRILIE